MPIGWRLPELCRPAVRPVGREGRNEAGPLRRICSRFAVGSIASIPVAPRLQFEGDVQGGRILSAVSRLCVDIH